MVTNRTVSVELPEELVDILGSPAEVTTKAREALVFALLREGRISQGKAAELLHVTRWDMLDLLAQHEILSGPETPQEAREELARLEQVLGPANDTCA
jgi:predicted HTH domain antitoxin